MMNQDMNPESNSCSSCDEFASLSRRGFLGTTALVGASSISQMSFGAGRGSERTRDTLVVVFLRGGMDGLTTVVPYGDTHLYSARPTLAVSPPGQSNGALDLDGFFGFAPSCAALMPAFQRGDLALIHAAGSTDPTRSHFSAMRYMETATPNMGQTTITDGWMGRHLQTSTPVGAGDLRALAVQSTLPRSMSGGPGAIPVSDPSDFSFPGTPALSGALRSVIESTYGRAAEPLKGAASSSMGAIDLLAGIDFDNYQPANGANYPGGDFGSDLVAVAAMIKADIGLECVEVDIPGWDMHASMGPINGNLATKLEELSGGLNALYTDLNAELGRVTVVVMSEFGRRVAENGSGGTDHGHGGVMMVLGGNVNGGQVHTQWPGLDPASLGNGDLPITIDYRDVLSEILELRLGSSALPTIFPQHTPQFPGVIG
jgi:uncharacterized protein (DUF1501 family)